MNLKPGKELRVDFYVNADFGGLFSVDDKQDPISVKSRTGYVITYRGAPLMWASKMQTQDALSTMEAEYIVLRQSMCDLIPIREILKEVMRIVFDKLPSISYHSHCKALDNTVGSSAHVIPQSTVFEDNDACLKFARMPKLTPRTKHIGILTIGFALKSNVWKFRSSALILRTNWLTSSQKVCRLRYFVGLAKV